jgi:putative colanic acid biosynthesis glycosyltransferase WcaI
MPDSNQAPARPRLLVLNQYYGPAESTGQLLREMCEDLVGELDVTVVAARPSDEETKRMPHAGVDVRWVPATSFGKGSIVLRLLNYLTFLVAALPVALRAPRPDVVLCMTNPPFIGILGALAARLRRAALVITVQDVHPDVGVISGRLTSKPIVWALGKVQRYLARRADRIVVISEAMRQRLVERGADPEGVVVIGNWIDADEIAPQPRDNPWAREHGLVGSFTVMHAVNVGLLQDIETFVDAAELVPDARFVIVGEGANKEALIERARAKGLDNVEFVPRQPREALGELLASADAHVVSLMPGLAGLMEPSKLYGILAAARPVLAGMEPGSEAAEVIERSDCGVISRPGEPESFAAAARQLAELGPEGRERMGERGRAYCEEFCNRRRSTGAYRELVLSLAA